MDKTDFYDWQLEAFDRIEGRSAVLSAPTGSGKTIELFYILNLLKIIYLKVKKMKFYS